MLFVFYQLSIADLMLDLVNSARQKAGVGALTLDANCMASAKVQSDDQAAHLFMGHVGSDGSTLGDRISKTGFKWDAVAENVAEGQKTVEEVMTAWLNSPGHRENLLNPVYTRFGYCESTGSDGNIYWTQDFAHPMGDYAPPAASVPATQPPPAASVPVTQPPPAAASVPATQPAPTAPSPQQPTTSAPYSSPSTGAENARSHSSSYGTKNVISSWLPRFTISSLPNGVHYNDPKQYAASILSALKSTTPAAAPNARYDTGHPGVSGNQQYVHSSYAAYTKDGSSSSARKLGPLFSLYLMFYL